ncbi:MAG: hypothetical protein LBK91_05760 [Synergistaceae bacterium]|jgi:hypothetical protein|nr:hypothetical protein [Synergistaceae bacterium]
MGFDGISDDQCAVARCKIDGRTSDGSSVNGISLCVVYSGDVIYHGELFSRESIETDAPLSELYSMLESERLAERKDDMARYEEQLSVFIASSDLFRNKKNLNDVKALEHKITYFCASSLSLNAISFLEIETMSMEELRLSIPSLEKSNPAGGYAASDEPLTAADGAKSDGKTPPSEAAAICEPILDPVSGLAAGDLSVGDVIFCRLPEDSVFYRMMRNAAPGFDGVVSGDISAIHGNALGSVTVVLRLSEGIFGTLKLTGAVRVKTASPKTGDSPRKTPPSRMAVIAAVAGAAAFLCVMILLSYFLD